MNVDLRSSGVLASLILAVTPLALGCGEAASGGSASASGAPASSTTSAAPLATMGEGGRLVYRDGRALVGGANLSEVREAALVRVTREKVSLEDVAVDDVPPLALKLRRADGLFQALRRRQDDERGARPFEKPNEIVILDIDDDVPATAVKSVFQTCAHAGFPTVLFLQSRR